MRRLERGWRGISLLPAVNRRASPEFGSVTWSVDAWLSSSFRAHCWPHFRIPRRGSASERQKERGV